MQINSRIFAACMMLGLLCYPAYAASTVRLNGCIKFEEGQSMSLRGKVVQEIDTEPEGGGAPYKYMVLKLEGPICFKNDPDTRIDVVALEVAKKWVGRHVVVTGAWKLV